MNNLTTRKIVLGMLMTLVLAFSVQGTADAITKFTKSTSTDYQVRSINEPFTITFSISTQRSADIKDNQDRLVTENGETQTHIDSDGYPGTWGDHDSNADTPHTFKRTAGAAKVSDSLRKHYNDEAIGISVTRNGTPLSGSFPTEFTVRRSGTSIPLVETSQVTGTPTDTSASLYESATNSNRQLSGSLTCLATTRGVYVITIKDITSTDDTPAGYTAATPITFTIYVWRNEDSSRHATIETGLSNGTAQRYGIVKLSVGLTGTGSDYAKVEFEVTRGPGRLYEDKDGDGKADKSASSKLTTFTNNLGTANTANVVLMPNRGTSHVRAWVAGNAPGTTTKSTEAIYSFGYSQLRKVSGDSPRQTAPTGSRLEAPFIFELVDSTGRTKIPGADVSLTVAGGGGSLRKDPNFSDDLYHDDFSDDSSETKTVETDSDGRASVFLVTGTEGVQSVTATFGEDSSDGGDRSNAVVTFTATAESATDRTPQTIEIMPETDGQRANQYGVLEKALTVVVRDQYGDRLPLATVEFEERDGGTILPPSSSKGDPGREPEADSADSTSRRRDIKTNASGQASVRYLAAEGSGAQRVTATLENGSRRFVTFTINGTPSSRQQPTPTPPADTTDDEDDEDDEDEADAGTLIVFPSSLSGAPGAVVPMSVGPSTATIVGDVAFILGGGLVSGTATARNVTLPDTAGSYNLTASATGYANVTVPVTVGTGTGTGTDTQPGTLTITTVGDRVGTQQQIRVTVRDAANALAVGAVTVTLTGALNPPTVSTLNGTGTAVVTLPTATGAHTLTVSATGYGTSSVTIPATGSQPPAQQQPQPVGQASSIRLASEPFPSGTANTQLAQPLRVQVLDANNTGVANVRVIFRVVSGQGRLSQRGNGRAVAVQTNVSGEARATYTPLSAASTVRATAASVSQTVTFTISAGSAPPPTTTPSTPDTDVTPSRDIDPVVQVNASQRPPMLWIDGGSIYALVGASVQKFASGVDNALNIAVGGGKVYWTEKTGDSAGTINSANLNGSNVQELASILAVPMGIAVSSDKLYWTNSRGRIQSANLDGSGITNVIPGGLEGAMDLAVAGGNAYWTQGGNVRFVNLTGQKQIRDISTGMDTANSLAIGGGKVYWAEMTGESAGTVNSANLNGTGATELASISAVPSGIAVDTARSKLYWTNSRGRIQRANLNGSGIGNVVTGLGNPGDMVSSNSITAPAATPPTTTTTAPAPKKYDVNGDGSVDSKDVDAIIVAVAAKITDAKYDVTGDGTVDINDVVAVSANQNTGAAAAPALLGTKLSIVQIDRLQEQIDLLIASNDRSPDALRILTYLQQLIVMARPEKTQLLANYPNPFNPETWIPYELATDTTVKITIYNTQGVVIRTLALGHQSAGYYTGRDRAAYWDGRNALGEQVASGIYFYQFETDEMSSMRKMVILK